MSAAPPSVLRLYIDLVSQTSLAQLSRRARRIVKNKVFPGLRAFLRSAADSERRLYRRLAASSHLERAARLYFESGSRAASEELARVLEASETEAWPVNATFWSAAIKALRETHAELAESITVRARESLKREFTSEGSPKLALGQVIDWQPGEFDHCEKTYALNRLYHLPLLAIAARLNDDGRCLEEFEDLLHQWVNSNTDRRGKPWNELTTALRLNSILLAYGCLRGTGRLGARAHLDVMLALTSHADYLAANLEYDILNNHLVFEGRSLIEAACAFPRLPGAKRWLKRGMAALDRELAHQVRHDGCHAEQSTGYHMQVLQEYLTAVAILRSGGSAVPAQWEPALQRMTDFLVEITRPDGTPPMQGDTALHDPQTPYVEEVLCCAASILGCSGLYAGERPMLRAFCLLGDKLPSPTAEVFRTKASGSRLFPDGGCCILRGDTGDARAMVSFDCGPFALEDSPAHGHADALSFEFSAFGRNLVVDPGVFTYQAGRWRDFFRGTRAHNTIGVDGTDQVHLWGAFRAYRPNGARLLSWGDEGGLAWADAEYLHRASGVVHRRRLVLLESRLLLIADRLWRTRAHDFCWRLHFPLYAAEFRANQCGHLLIVRAARGGDSACGLAVLCHSAEGDLLEIVEGSEDPPQGWISYAKGVKEAAPVLEWTRRAEREATFFSALFPFQGDTLLDEFSLHVAGDPAGEPILGVRVGPKEYELRLEENRPVWLKPSR